MLLGADIIGNLLIGEEVKLLKGGLVAVNTHLGWTVMGKMKMEKERHSNVLLSLHVSDNCIKDLWNLDQSFSSWSDSGTSFETGIRASATYSAEAIRIPQHSTYVEKKVPVLGLIWKPDKDTLSVTLHYLNWEENSKINEIPITKSKILSAVHCIFDPIGFTYPVTLDPKILLQECWKLGVAWDTELPLSISRKFKRWKEHLKCLNNLEIPRCISKELSPNSDLSLHVFCDASKPAYASCVFLRAEVGGSITCQLVQARARVAPIKPITIPRLELLACTIGSRLMNTTKVDLGLENVPICCWVQEIRRLTNPKDWKHIPGILNSADLPSRGCGVVELIASLWWEGPSWLNEPREEWPLSEACPDCAIINSERKRTVASTINHEPKETDYLSEISSYKKIIRITAWIYRFYHNLRKPRNDRDFGELITQ
ncbi:uncharacterized protein TNCV_4768171 [Trichonephila clavipes]|nr:uncharacterized protein TNCV_4768171 [Trichonephila clavipes]